MTATVRAMQASLYLFAPALFAFFIRWILSLTSFQSLGIGFALFYPAVAFSAWRGGFKYGSFTTLFALLLFGLETRLFERHSFDYLNLGIFLTECVFISLIIGRLQHKSASNLSARLRSEEASKAKSLFLKTMSHEIQLPAGVISGFSELLIGDLKTKKLSDQEKIKILDRIKSNVKQLERNLNDLIQTSKDEDSHLSVHFEPTNLKVLVQRAIDSMQVQAAKADSEIEFIQESDLPELIETDSIRMTQVLMNLIENAIKFSEKNTIRVVARSRTITSNREKIIFRIEDKGLGIRRDQVESLFEGPTSLGLALARKLAQSLQGNVVLARSGPKKGSIFVFEFEARVLPKPEGADSLSTTSSANLNGLRILVVDDSRDSRMLMKHQLNGTGAIVGEAVDGAQGISKALQEEYDVVLMDIQMPVMNGLEAIRKLRSHAFTKGVIAVSAHTKDDDRDECLRAGSDRYLAKPVRPGDLISEIASLCGRSPALA